MQNSSKEKTLISVRSDLVSKLNEVANRHGRNFNRIMTEILKQAVRAYGMKRSLREIIDEYELLEVHREAGEIFVSRDILDHLINKIHTDDAETFRWLWHQTGRRYGIHLRAKFNDPIEIFVRLLKDGRWDLNEVRVERDQELVEFKCFSTLLSEERTAHLQEFIEGAMSSMGFEAKEKECFRGIVRLKFSPSNAS